MSSKKDIVEESFKPINHYSKNIFLNTLLFYIRLWVDFQFRTIYYTLKKELPAVEGHVIDVGCGNSPFKHLLDSKTKYTGLDYNQSFKFMFSSRNDIVYFAGKQFPFSNECFDYALCTEVLEHIVEPELFINEIYRILRVNGKALITVPWSARDHYIPNDFYRYTPVALQLLFGKFEKIVIKPRGTDLTVICAKSIVFYMRLITNIFNNNKGFIKYMWKIITNLLTAVILFPFLIFVVIIGHISLVCNIGSTDDCLGYTILLEK